MSIVLVTGATGLVGYHIVCRLLADGRRVRALVRRPEQAATVLPRAVELVQGRLESRTTLRAALHGCEAVYHAAGIPEQWRADPDDFARVNVQGTQKLVSVALELGVRRFVYVSTVDVFQANAGDVFHESALAQAPRATAYGRSKQNADRLVASALGRGLPAVFVHPAAVYGPGPGRAPHLNRFIEWVIAGKVPAVPPGTLPLVFARDVAAGCVSAEQAAPGERYIFCESCPDLAHIARLVHRSLGNSRAARVLPLWLARTVARVGEAAAARLGGSPVIQRGQLQLLQWRARPSSAKAQLELGWAPTPLLAGVQQTVAQLLQPLPRATGDANRRDLETGGAIA